MVLVKDLKVVPVKAVKVVKVEVEVEVKVVKVKVEMEVKVVIGDHTGMRSFYVDMICWISLVLKFTEFASLVYRIFENIWGIFWGMELGDY